MMFTWPPRSFRQWLLFASPGAAAVLAVWTAATWFPLSPLHINGTEIPNVQGAIDRALVVNLSTVATLSIVLALLSSRERHGRAYVASVITTAVALVVVNAFVSFAGCAAVAFAASFR
jgi:hypothetical protein